MSEIVEGRIIHQTPVRLRVAAPAKRHDRAFFEALRARVSRSAPATRVAVNPAAASIVIHSRDSQTALEMLRRDGALTIVEPAERVVGRGVVVARPRFAAVDARIRQWSGGRVDAKSVSVVLVVVVSLAVKLARGNAMSAGVLLLLYAGGIARRRLLAPDRGRKDERLAPSGEGAF